MFEKADAIFNLPTHLFPDFSEIGISTFPNNKDGCQGITGPNPSTFLHKLELVRTFECKYTLNDLQIQFELSVTYSRTNAGHRNYFSEEFQYTFPR